MRRHRHPTGVWTLAAALAITAGCSDAPAVQPAPGGEGPESKAAAEAAPIVDPRRCKPSRDTTGSPATIDEAVALINVLPSPVTAECFVEALDRPLRLEASNSHSSLQPAEGKRSPRVFIFSGETLVITIVLDGKGRDLIEFGQLVSPYYSLKGELAFPLQTPVATTEPHEQIRNPEYPRISRCFVCHDAERPSPTIPRGLESLTIRPSSGTIVPVVTLQLESESCNAAKEPARCAYLQALVGHGPIAHQPFPEQMRSF